MLDMAGIERFVRTWDGLPGRPADDRRALAHALTAKAVFGLSTTAALIERLQLDATLRRLCGWERVAQVPGEWTFSRAFAEFAASQLPARVHEALIIKTLGGQLVGHISRDAMAIEVRDKPVRSEKPEPVRLKRKRGRPRTGEVVEPKAPRRIEVQTGQTLPHMLADLPIVCSLGSRRNAKGHSTRWIGYKLQIDTADGDIPISGVLTSASVHDSPVSWQVAIPPATITAARVSNLYDLMDSAVTIGVGMALATPPCGRVGDWRAGLIELPRPHHLGLQVQGVSGAAPLLGPRAPVCW